VGSRFFFAMNLLSFASKNQKIKYEGCNEEKDGAAVMTGLPDKVIDPARFWLERWKSNSAPFCPGWRSRIFVLFKARLLMRPVINARDWCPWFFLVRREACAPDHSQVSVGAPARTEATHPGRARFHGRWGLSWQPHRMQPAQTGVLG
jgi:hypothetical protein